MCSRIDTCDCLSLLTLVFRMYPSSRFWVSLSSDFSCKHEGSPHWNGQGQYVVVVVLSTLVCLSCSRCCAGGKKICYTISYSGAGGNQSQGLKATMPSAYRCVSTGNREEALFEKGDVILVVDSRKPSDLHKTAFRPHLGNRVYPLLLALRPI